MKIIIWLAIIITFTSCSTQTINIKEDGTASVEINLFKTVDSNINEKDSTVITDTTELDKEIFQDYHKAIRELYSSNIIENFRFDTIQNGGIKFDIKHIDSLGFYIDPLFRTIFDFKLTKKKLIIIGPDGKSDPEDDITGATNMIPIYTLIKFEKKIGKIITNNNYIKKIDDRTIEIKTSLGEINYNEIGNKAEIFFK